MDKGLLTESIAEEITPIANLILPIMAVMVFFILGIYLYFSLAYMRIGRKAGLSIPGIAWMPFYGPLVIIFEVSKAHWWPFLILVVGYLCYPLMVVGMALNPVFMGVLAILFSGSLITFLIVHVIWHWKTYQAVGRPGWWIIAPALISFAGVLLFVVGALAKTNFLFISGTAMTVLGLLSHFVFLGIAAWGKAPEKTGQNRGFGAIS